MHAQAGPPGEMPRAQDPPEADTTLRMALLREHYHSMTLGRASRRRQAQQSQYTRLESSYTVNYSGGRAARHELWTNADETKGKMVSIISRRGESMLNQMMEAEREHMEAEEEPEVQAAEREEPDDRRRQNDEPPQRAATPPPAYRLAGAEALLGVFSAMREEMLRRPHRTQNQPVAEGSRPKRTREDEEEPEREANRPRAE